MLLSSHHHVKFALIFIIVLPCLAHARDPPFLHKPNSAARCQSHNIHVAFTSNHIDDVSVMMSEQIDVVPAHLDLMSPLMLTIFTTYAVFASLLILFFAYRYVYCQHISHTPTPATTTANTPVTVKAIVNDNDDDDDEDNVIDDDDNDDDDDDGVNTKQCGYVNSIFGTVMFSTLVILSVSLSVFLFIIGLDFYKVFGAQRLFGATGQLYSLFITVWHIDALCLCVLKACSTRLRNAFRLPAHLSQADIVEIWRARTIPLRVQKPSLAVRIALWMDDFSASYLGTSGTYENISIQRDDGGTRYIQYRCQRHSYDEANAEYTVNDINAKNETSRLTQQDGSLSSQEAARRFNQVGPNIINVPCASFLQALYNEMFTLFFIYQLKMIWVWFAFSHYRMAVSMMALVTSSILVKVYTSALAERKVKRMAVHISECSVYRDDVWQQLSSTELVPGDLIKVKNGQTMPCDASVMHGTVVVDESMLSGEARPVRKFELPASSSSSSSSSSSKNTLFAGTLVLQCEPSGAGENTMRNTEEKFSATAIVSSTGAATLKGKMVVSILFPQPVSFVFDQEITVLFMILGVWGLLAAFASAKLTGPCNGTWFYAMCTLASVLSPLLPAMLVVGQSISAQRLAKKHVTCLQTRRVTLAGKVSIACFDKTGTLTQQGLQFAGAQSIRASAQTGIQSFSRCHKDVSKLPPMTQMALACAHSITVLDDGTPVGPPVDVEMFSATRWIKTTSCHVQSANGKHHAEVLRVIPFDHNLMRMLVVVRDVDSGVVHVFCKGSFESIKQLSNCVSLPSRFDHVTYEHARNGTYTLGLAHKILADDFVDRIDDLSREELESDLNAAGLILFRNRLKPDSQHAISLLRKAGVRPVMITGDNALTGICVAREANMMKQIGAPVFLADVDEVSGEVVWTNTDTGERVNVDELIATKCDESSLCSSSNSTLLSRVSSAVPDEEGSMCSADNDDEDDDDDDDDNDDDEDERCSVSRSNSKNSAFTFDSAPSYIRHYLGFELAMTGPAFRIIASSGDELCQYLLLTRVFARMSPKDKVACVQMHMRAGSIVAMCGDGGNDCGALRTAHVGLALSDSDASIVSPFSTTSGSINSMVELLRHGRCSLATSFATFKFIILHGEEIAITKILTSYFGVAMGQNVWIFLDTVICMGLAWTLTMARPAKKLTHRRPTARLFGAETVLSVIGTLLINLAFFVIVFIWMWPREFFECNMWPGTADMTEWWLLTDNFEVEIIVFVMCAQVLTAAAMLNLGGEYRAKWARNFSFLCVLGVMVTSFIYALIGPHSNFIACFFCINCKANDNVIPFPDRLQLALILALNSLAVWAFQFFGVIGPVRKLLRGAYPIEKPALPL